LQKDNKLRTARKWFAWEKPSDRKSEFINQSLLMIIEI